MNSKALRVLEYNKIKDKMKSYASTEATKDLIEDLKPYDNIYEVKEHIEETREANDLLYKKGSPPFEGLYDTRNAIYKCRKEATLFPGELIKIANMLRCSRRFTTYVKNDNSDGDESEGFRVLNDLCLGITNLKFIEDEIYSSILGENEISDRASAKLSSIRRSLKDKNASTKDKVNSLIRTYSKYLQDSLYTIRGDRYVIPVRAEFKGSVPGLIHDQSASGATLFIEPMSLVNLNNEIRELALKEKAEIERILAELSSKVYINIEEVFNNSNIVNELDFIFAKAKFGESIEGVCPEVSDRINIVEGRHPLIDRKQVVPISVQFGGDVKSLVITGPNTGGKTVTLKTIGLIHLMGLSGLMIPANDGSVICYYKEVFADIGDEQSIEQSLSTFSSHMTNIVNIIEKADENSLVLFDELGAGTDPTEGAALAVSILEELRFRNTFVVATTHYSELKIYALKTEGVENASVEFDIETLRPTYRLLIGIPGKSNAFEISKRLGLPDYIIDKSRERINSDSLEFEDLLQSLHDKTKKAEEELQESEIFKRDALKYKDRYKERYLKIENSKDKILIEAESQARSILKEAKEEADNMMKNIRELERKGYSLDDRKSIEEQRLKLKAKIEKEHRKSTENSLKGDIPKKIQEGDELYLPSLNQKVIILTKPDSKGVVQAQAGIMKINVKVKDLRSIENQEKEVKVRKKREVSLNLKSVDSSLDLRGMDAEEAIYVTDKYLDQAYVAGLGEVILIHGKGTGKLRESINKMLKNHKHIKNYRIGEYGEGGSGVTVAILKN
ncbi:MAG: endonuclease MutS2 [Clostridiaceae bacterium]